MDADLITEKLYNKYFNYLLQGKRAECSQIVQDLLDRDIDIKNLYTDLFQKSLYKVGELWEYNKISVAKEHLASSITESLLNLIYPRLFDKRSSGKNKKVIVSCAANEYHQIGGKMVADIFELHGWDSYFLGANTPYDQLINYIDEVKPDIAGLSLSVYFNLNSFNEEIDALKSNFTNLDIFVGGQAFKWGGTDLLRKHKGIHYIDSLDILEKEIA